jgi:hypothetical protein
LIVTIEAHKSNEATNIWKRLRWLGDTEKLAQRLPALLDIEDKQSVSRNNGLDVLRVSVEGLD